MFEVAKGSNAITTLASFNTFNEPYDDGLAVDGHGNIYGTTALGGASYDCASGNPGYGTVFEIANGSDTVTAVASLAIP